MVTINFETKARDKHWEYLKWTSFCFSVVSQCSHCQVSNMNHTEHNVSYNVPLLSDMPNIDCGIIWIDDSLLCLDFAHQTTPDAVDVSIPTLITISTPTLWYCNKASLCPLWANWQSFACNVVPESDPRLHRRFGRGGGGGWGRGLPKPWCIIIHLVCTLKIWQRFWLLTEVVGVCVCVCIRQTVPAS